MPSIKQANEMTNAHTIHRLPNIPATKMDCNIDLDKNEWSNCNVVSVANAYQIIKKHVTHHPKLIY